ncbi:MAG: response regulator [Candidatus Sericytochromatia bacterium]
MPARILIAEDNPQNQALMLYLLRAFGHEPLAADNGKACLELLSQESVDLLLVDLQMPILDGYGVLEVLRRESRWRTLPVVAVTALAMLGDREQALRAGFDGYIAKPIEPEHFISQVDAYLAPALRALPRAKEV